VRRHADALSERPGKVAAGKTCDICELLESDLGRDLTLDELSNAPQRSRCQSSARGTTRARLDTSNSVGQFSNRTDQVLPPALHGQATNRAALDRQLDTYIMLV